MPPAQPQGLALDAEDLEQGTRLQLTNGLLTQKEFATALTANRGADVLDVFIFRKPRSGLAPTTRKNASQKLVLNPQQHAVMFALAGCIDVMYVMSRVTAEVRKVIHNEFGIDKKDFHLWFKNRAPVKRRLLGKLAGEAAAADHPFTFDPTNQEQPSASISAGASSLSQLFSLGQPRADVATAAMFETATPYLSACDLEDLFTPGGQLPSQLQQQLRMRERHMQSAAAIARYAMQPLTLEAAVLQFHDLTCRGGMSGIELMLCSAQPSTSADSDSSALPTYDGLPAGADARGRNTELLSSPTLETLVRVMKAGALAPLGVVWPTSCSMTAAPCCPFSNANANALSC